MFGLFGKKKTWETDDIEAIQEYGRLSEEWNATYGGIRPTHIADASMDFVFNERMLQQSMREYSRGNISKEEWIRTIAPIIRENIKIMHKKGIK